MSVYSKENHSFLRQSIDSILAQTAPCNEFVIVCDGALTEALDQVLDEFQIAHPNLFKLLRLPENVGLGKALNAGLALCNNVLIARMDSDDIAMPTRSEKQLALFESETVDIVGSAVCEFQHTPNDTTTKRQTPLRHDDIIRYAKTRNPFNHPSVMFRKQAVQAVGGYHHFPFFEDYHLWVRMLMAGAKGRNLEQTLLHMRTGDGMYRRRGGLAYLKCVLRFRWWLLRVGFSGIGGFLKSVVVQTVMCLVPTALRVRVYKYLLRG